MTFHSYSPGPVLSRFVTSFWLYRSGPQPHPRSRSLPTGTSRIVVDLSGDGVHVPDAGVTGGAPTVAGALFNGATTRYLLDAGGFAVHYMGVDFRPGGAYPFVGPPAGELRDAHLALDTLWGGAAVDDLRERLLQAQTPAERVPTLRAGLPPHR